MTRFVSLSAAAGLALGGIVFTGCQNDDHNPDNPGNAQTSGQVYSGSSSSTDNPQYNGTNSSDRNNEEPGRGPSSTDMETHGGPSKITGGENVDHNGIGVTDDMRAGFVNNSGSTIRGSSDVSTLTTRPSDAAPTTQPSVEITR